jgi:hypothetical protein
MRPPIAGCIHSVFEPAFGLTRPQEIETGEQDDESQNSERKAGGNVVKPNSEKKWQEIHHRRRDQDVFPVALINAEAFQVAKNIWSGMSSSHLGLKVSVHADGAPLRDLPENGDDRSESES